MDSPASLRQQAKHLRDVGKYKESEAVFDKVIAAVEEELTAAAEVDRDVTIETLAELHNERGHVRYLQVAFTEAVEDYTHALKLNNQLALAFYNRGLIHYRLARFDAAIADMDSCLSMKPEFDSAKDCRQQSVIDKQEHMIKFPHLYQPS